MFTLPSCIIAVDVNTYIITLINLINLLTEKNRSFVVKILFKLSCLFKKLQTITVSFANKMRE